jgi:hypothetical protein
LSYTIFLALASVYTQFDVHPSGFWILRSVPATNYDRKNPFYW